MAEIITIVIVLIVAALVLAWLAPAVMAAGWWMEKK
jgi:hypothetical protein